MGVVSKMMKEAEGRCPKRRAVANLYPLMVKKQLAVTSSFAREYEVRDHSFW